MVERVITALIYIAVIVGLVWLAVWVLGMLGIVIPGTVMNVIWVIIVLVCILVAWRAFKGTLPSLLP
jgi:hypothetical protein